MEAFFFPTRHNPRIREGHAEVSTWIPQPRYLAERPIENAVDALSARSQRARCRRLPAHVCGAVGDTFFIRSRNDEHSQQQLPANSFPPFLHTFVHVSSQHVFLRLTRVIARSSKTRDEASLYTCTSMMYYSEFTQRKRTSAERR